MTALKELIKKRIRDHGPMTMAEYMALCLGHPEHGYYMTRDPFGEKGDFTTAPEISQIFGELIGAWCLQAWHDLGEPESLNLIEIGPGRGTLMADMLRICFKNERFRDAARICLIETSPALQKIQAEKLSQYDIQWRTGFTEDGMEEAPLICIANELLDALPVHQFIKRHDHWHERAVSLNTDDEMVIIETAPSFDPRLAALHQEPETGDIFELCPAGQTLVRDVARVIAQRHGAALFIDYGYAHSAFGDTLQAVKNHQFTDILDSPGMVDLTAHVDFERMRLAAEKQGVRTAPIVSQGTFLNNLGLPLRADMLKSCNPEQGKDIDAAALRLAGTGEMGQLFKVLGFSDPTINIAGFENVYL